MSYQYPKVPHPATRAHFERLMWRAGFSGSAKQIDAYQKMGLEAAVAKFLAPVGSPKMIGPAPTDGGNPIDPLNQWGHDCLWWLDKMVRTPNQGQERMTLNLHDHFATSNSGVGNTRHMLRQNKLLRSHAVGNFRDLLHDITHDPAMLLWLNGADSNKWAPNENYAREVMELFCLGNDASLEAETYGLWRKSRMYKQDDIHEAARALTGWRYDWDKSQNGTTAQRENPTFYDKILARHRVEDDLRAQGQLELGRRVQDGYRTPQSRALYLLQDVEVLHPDEAVQGHVADDGRQLQGSGNSLKPVLGVILRSSALYANLDSPDLVKPPVVFVAANLRHREPVHHREQLDVAAWKGWASSRSTRRTSRAGIRTRPGSTPTRPTPTGRPPTTCSAATPSRPGRARRRRTRAISGAVGSIRGSQRRPASRATPQSFFNNHKRLFDGKHVLGSHERVERQQVLRALILGGPDGYLP